MKTTKPWLNEKKLRKVFDLPEIHSDTDAVGYFRREGFEVARRTISDARSKFGIPAKTKKSIIEEIDFEHDDFGYEELWTAVLQMQEAISSIRRDKREARFRFNTSEPIAVAFMGDVHMGDIGTNYKQLLADIELIRQTENLFLVTGGDYINNFVKQTKLYNAYEVVQPRIQWKMVEWFFTQLQNSLLAVATGNHDAWTEELTQFDALYSIIKNLDFLYTKHGATLDLEFPNQNYKIMFKHNVRTGSSLNPTHGVKTMMRTDGSADVGVLFDTHVPAYEEFMLEGEWRIAIRTGSYKTDDQWGAAMGFPDDVRVSVPTVVFHPKERKFMGTRSLQEGVSLLQWAREAYRIGEF